MKISTFGFAVAVLTVGIGAAGGGYWLAQRQAKHELLPSSAPTDERKVLYWYDPMQPEQRFDKPGKSPFMDMELVPKYAGSEQDPSVLSVPAQAVQNLGMRTSTVIRGVLPSDIEVVGSLAYNQREVANLQARAGGFVERVYGRAPGDVLPAGTPLVDLLIPEWSAAQLEFLAVLRTGDARLITAAQERLRLLGMPQALIEQVRRSGKPRAVQTLTTPISGELQALQVRAGMTVEAGQDLALINGLSSVWLDAAIPEAMAGSIQVGDEIRANLTAFPDRPLLGRVIALLPSADPQTRTLTVRSELPNPAGKLRPGMFAAVRLNSAVEQSTLLVPSEAVIRTGKRALVMLAEGDGRYRPPGNHLGPRGRWASGGVVRSRGRSGGRYLRPVPHRFGSQPAGHPGRQCRTGQHGGAACVSRCDSCSGRGVSHPGARALREPEYARYDHGFSIGQLRSSCGT